MCLQAEESEADFEVIEEKIRQEDRWTPVDQPKYLDGSYFLEGKAKDPEKLPNYQIEKAFYWKILTLNDSLL